MLEFLFKKEIIIKESVMGTVPEDAGNKFHFIFGGQIK